MINFPAANERMVTSFRGPSQGISGESESRPGSSEGLPILKLPPGITTISGQSEQSRNCCPGLKFFWAKSIAGKSNKEIVNLAIKCFINSFVSFQFEDTYYRFRATRNPPPAVRLKSGFMAAGIGPQFR